MNLHRRLPLAACVLSASLACDEEPVKVDAGPDLPPVCGENEEGCNPYDQVHVFGTWAQDLCGFMLDCCTGSERLAVARQLLGDAAASLDPQALVDDDACLRAVADALALQQIDGVIATTEGRRQFNETAAQTCGDVFDAARETCTAALLAFGPPAECGRIFDAAVGQGGECVDARDCLIPERGSFSTCFKEGGPVDGGFVVALYGTCQPLPALGEPCAPIDGECEGTLFCAPSALQCVPRAAVGESCVGLPCEVDGFCDAATLTCAAKFPPLSPCVDTEQCAASVCDPDLHLCIPPPAIDPATVTVDFCLGE